MKERSQLPLKASIRPLPGVDELAQGMAAIADGAQELLRMYRNPQEPTGEMQKWLVERISEGRFAAFGVRSPPQGIVEMSPIPAAFFKGHPKINWSKGMVENFGQRYEAVEVANDSASSAKPLQRKLGAPRKDDKVEQVATELRDANRFRGLIKKQQVALVQLECRKRFPDLFPRNNLPSETLVRAVLARLK
jgi:hypothetical protein